MHKIHYERFRRRKFGIRGLALVVSMSLGLSACDLAPEYHPQTFLYPNGWQGKGIMVDAHPADDVLPGDWWSVLRDPILDDLEARLLKVNPDLQAAAESFTQARDMAREAESRLYPQLAGAGHMSDNKGSLGRLFNNREGSSLEYESNEAYSGAATWEPDFWSKIRNSTRMEKNLAQASAADYAQAKLSLEAELASDYITLRGLDAQNEVYNDSIRYFQTAVEITRLRQEGAIGAGLDVSRSENQLYSAMAAQSRLVAERQVIENAMAVLLNTAPAAFHIQPVHDVKLHFGVVPINAGVPSTLLQRRPDIAAAERRMAAASRAIGVSRAAFYPDISISASGGFENAGFDLGGISNAFWRIAVEAVEPVFTGGLRRAALQRSWSQYRQSVDEYRSTVLSAFGDVENGLTQTVQYRTSQEQQSKAVDAALRTQHMTMSLYTGGLSNYLDALVAQQDALQARLSLVRVQTAQVQASVRLMRALGGGWNADSLPKTDQINPFGVLQYNNLRTPKAVGGVDNNESTQQNDLRGLTH
ncbi:secretion system type I outer membrane efflux pump lipoprotein NodT [Neokomagataea thailandica NBRC 106555]|uniref:Efflux transporter outer membrane subunit n=2 Tax=Neokomagataea TaxID=1223423 RepID=A0A4Y6V5T0_9PROT|nr:MULTISPECIES: efflux transporter outer membrane subunit [Neokomagataea]QDH24218.1 efflux transporter outer membrane subunit [Neokomagataea tanensis]GBR52822.1 secretion system type I outer membrane efflux pump lipoprotein NodT [Neokomagataea thailandica NBRC 106555]